MQANQPSLFTVHRIHFLLHPRPNTAEIHYTPENIQEEEQGRINAPNGLSVTLIGDPRTESIVMIIDHDFRDPRNHPWRIYIHRSLWARTSLNRSAQDVEQLFEVHPLGWASEPHRRRLERWGAENGLVVSAVEGRSGRLYMRSV